MCKKEWSLSFILRRSLLTCGGEIKIKIVFVDYGIKLHVHLLQWFFFCEQVVPIGELFEASRELSTVHDADGVDLAEDHNVDDADRGARHVAHVRQVPIDFA